jgi:pilus assembly protein FimV
VGLPATATAGQQQQTLAQLNADKASLELLLRTAQGDLAMARAAAAEATTALLATRGDMASLQTRVEQHAAAQEAHAREVQAVRESLQAAYRQDLRTQRKVLQTGHALEMQSQAAALRAAHEEHVGVLTAGASDVRRSEQADYQCQLQSAQNACAQAQARLGETARQLAVAQRESAQAHAALATVREQHGAHCAALGVELSQARAEQGHSGLDREQGLPRGLEAPRLGAPLPLVSL